MIEKIIELKNIRSFLDFSADEIKFGKKNIIYAPNGNGKTNLSRVFRKLSDSEQLDELLSQEATDPSDISYKIKCSGIDVTHLNFNINKNLFENIYVFNSDYIEDTIRRSDFSEIDVSGNIQIPLGEKSIEISNLENAIEKSNENRTNNKLSLLEEIEKLKDVKIESKEYTHQDINIWKELKLKNLIDNDFSITKPIEKEEFTDCESKFKKILSIDEETSIDFKEFIVIQASEINFTKITSDLKESKNYKVFDQTIKDSIETLTKNWIETDLIKKGIKLSKEKDSCLLCERVLDDSVNHLFDKYQAYFDDEESKFKDVLTEYSKSLKSLKSSINSINNNLENDVNEYSKLFDVKKIWGKITHDVLIGKIEDLLDAIKEKRDNLSKSYSILYENGILYSFDDEIAALNTDISSNIDLIKSVNLKFSKIKEQKTSLRTIIGQKFLYDYYVSNKGEFDTIEKESNRNDVDKSKLKIEQESLPTTKASENIKLLCNLFLHEYLYLTKYSIEEKEGVILLNLDSHDISKTTQKISEGEKTMVALSFFFASCIQKFNSSESFFKSVFIIDDPVNSTSYNYFFGVCNLIKYFDETIVKKLWNDDFNKLQASDLQKIILTHNTQFFNVMRTNVYKEKAEYFLLSNRNIKKIPKDQLQSEFEGALSKIKEAVSTNDYQKAIGNDLRRFFETIKHFYGIETFNANTLKTIFQEFKENKHNVFYTVVNYYSHGNPEAHTDPMPVNFEPFLKEFDELIKVSQFKELWDKIELN